MKTIFLCCALCAAAILFGAGTARAGGEKPFINVAEITLKPECREAFLAAVREEMRESLRVEPGVIALYAVADENDPNKLTSFDMYEDEAAYAAHCETPHFKKYIETTKDMAVSKSVKHVLPVELCDKTGQAAPAK